MAYCVDFEKDNPTQAESFDVADSPSNLDRVTAAIQEYSRKNPNTDITSAAQAAIWMAQGVSIDDIRTKFPVSSSEEILARSFLR